MIVAALLAAAIGSLAFASASSAASITGGVTTVDVTADLGGLGLGGAPFQDAELEVFNGLPRFSFGITGGETFADDSALIEHDGSGVTLFALADDTLSATVGNFVIDTARKTVFGDVIGGASDLALFTFGDIGETGIQLLIASDLAGALTGVFGAPDLTGAAFGLANTGPITGSELAPVPLPPSALLLGGVLAGVLALRRRSAAPSA